MRRFVPRFWPAVAAALALLLVSCGGAEPQARQGAAPHATGARPAMPRGVTYHAATRLLEDGQPVRLHVLTVARDADVTVRGVHGEDLATARTVREMTDGAVAAVNGSFFDIATGVHFGGYEGDPLGAYGTDGELLSEALNGTTSLVLGDGARPRITALSTASTVTSSDGAARTVDGIDRRPGRILGCGGVGGDRSAGTAGTVTAPARGRLCVDPSEIVDFRPQWGARSPDAGPGSVEAVLDGHGRVTALRSPAGGAVPPVGRTLVGTGEGARWLRSHGAVGSVLTVTHRTTDDAGREVGGAGVSVLGAGPRLVRDGRVRVDAAADGFPDTVLVPREPRTLAGVTSDGSLLLVVVDGRRPGASVGVRLDEAARILVSLGASDAMNLDGGGSSTMVVAGRLRNHPAEVPGRTGEERKVATALAVLARP
ncbi:phosphodiester glycosidase family protein [Streptomyces sp. CO7]